jgi:hypothetical protein
MLEATPNALDEPRRRRSTARRLAGLVLAVGAAGSLLTAGVALGANSTLSFSFRCDGQPVSNQCPKATRTTGKLSLLAQPDPLARARRIQFLFDNDFRFRPWVVPKCAPGQLASADMAQAITACGSTLIGTGTAAFGDPGGGGHVFGCVLLFNGTNDPSTRDPRILFYLRYLEEQSPNQLHCEDDPASNHGGDGTGVSPATLKTVAQGDYRTELDYPAPSFGFIPLGRLAFDLDAGTAANGYMKARCFDPDHVWNLRTKITYAVVGNPPETVSSTKTCKVG